MFEHLSRLGISLDRLRRYLIITCMLFAVRGVWAQAFHEFAYVVNSTFGDDFSGYRMNIYNGELIPLPGSPFAPGPYYPKYGAVNGVAIDSKDRFLYSLAAGGESLPPNVILGFSIGAHGALTPLPSAAAISGAYQSLALDPNNKFLYAVGPQAGVGGYSIDATTGLLTAVPGSPYDAGMFTDGVTIDPTGRFVYVREFFTSSLLGFEINPDTGALTPIPGSPFAGIYGPVVVDPTGRFLYSFSIIGGEINEYTIDHHTGALTLSPRSPFSTSVGTVGGVVDPTGCFLYVLDSHTADTQASDQVVGYFINRFTGGLTPLPSAPVPTGPVPSSLTVDPTGRFVYVTNTGDNTVSGYAIELWSGALRPLRKPTVTTGSGPSGIAVGAFISR